MAKARKSSKKVTRTRVSPVVTFKKEAKEDALPKQAATILAIVKSAKTLTVAEVQTKMVGKVETAQEMGAIWAFYRARLVKGGYINVAKAEKAPKAAKKAA